MRSDPWFSLATALALLAMAAVIVSAAESNPFLTLEFVVFYGAALGMALWALFGYLANIASVRGWRAARGMRFAFLVPAPLILLGGVLLVTWLPQGLPGWALPTALMVLLAGGAASLAALRLKGPAGRAERT